nr:isoform 2 of ubiquitin-conjugating enzyme e2 q2 [Quercus suber]
MPRKQFFADLNQTKEGVLPPGISSVQHGEDDGQLLFVFQRADVPSEQVRITAMIPDVSEYPTSHEYMIFCDDDTSMEVSQALEDISGINRKNVLEMLERLSGVLSRLTSDRDEEASIANPHTQELEDYAEDDIYPSDDEAFEIRTQSPSLPTTQIVTDTRFSGSGSAFRSRVRRDLRAVRATGFKAGHLGHLLDRCNCFVTISVRISKLGISDEAMQAWQIEPAEYLILLLQFPNGYRTHEELQTTEGNRLAPNIGFRVLTGKKYKPSIQEAIKAFTMVEKRHEGQAECDSPHVSSDEGKFDGEAVRETFISRPLNNLLKERLVPILKYRSAGMDWRGGEDMYMEVLQTGGHGGVIVPDRFYDTEPENCALPDLVNADHFLTPTTEKSFPVLAMQFLIRHFVRCTDFCLVCHRRLEDDMEAIKPYVCNSSLCLYQFMTLGFGPSIEHEILAQPYVVDLLVSFCYSSAAARKLKEFPLGLSLTVPPIDISTANTSSVSTYGRNTGQGSQAPPTISSSKAEVPLYEVGYDAHKRELIFFKKPGTCPVSRGSWIVLRVSDAEDSELHCRVSDVTYFPTISINEPIRSQAHPALLSSNMQSAKSRGLQGTNSAPSTKWIPSTFQLYDQDFEKLNDSERCHSICEVLATLPNVKLMQTYLRRSRSAELKQWVTRISPAAMSLLRWIIASNRACIMQVDGDREAAQSVGVAKTSTIFGTSPERVYGMQDFIQFRFAMGAPDKEQRFITEVRNKAASKQLQYPTIFAWHGSSLYNWHMIIREGLHFKNTDHGRAYGHGVYHAKEATTSLGYSSTADQAGKWPGSVLKINNALALNEIVNAPEEFVSLNPYYVVSQLDWIQTRYLFVSCSPDPDTISVSRNSRPPNAHPQDPGRTPTGMSGTIEIPASAIKSSRYSKDKRLLNEVLPSSSPLKKLKGEGGFSDPIHIDDNDDADSVATDEEDLVLLAEERHEAISSQVIQTKDKHENSGDPAIDFIPGILDWTTLPLMPLPEYAISGTTKHLLKELRNLDQSQQSKSLSELGWYIDVQKIENVYQWIVELHSFAAINPALPLVMDMAKKDLKSIVLEVRFNKDFPWTPPYVRIIRPRFINFAQGGGGHVVMGGAMCMELLTNSGWSAASSMESVFLQIRLAIASDPPARLDMHANGDYGIGEAADGYIRACRGHGWTVPPGFKEMAYAAGEASHATHFQQH